MFARCRALLGVVLVAIALQFTTACIPRQPGELTDRQLEQLRGCESHGDYRIVSASGKYRGAYQFDRRTWDSVAGRHWPSAVGADPAAAAPWLQDHLARKLEAERGLSPWPLCGKRVGAP